MTDRTPPLADAAARERISRDLDTTMLVEAAAGTGKTTKLIDRMIALIAEGRCGVETMAAVTFTRKAAAELRSRLGAAVERAARGAEGERRERLRAASARIERLFVGTIHSFCGDLLRKRPVEAGVPLGFRELDEEEDKLIRAEAWELHAVELARREDPILGELEELGLEVGSLRRAFLSFVNYPDVTEWPAPRPERPDPRRVFAGLEPLLARVRAVAPRLTPDAGGDNLMKEYRRIDRRARHLDPGNPAELFELVEGIEEFTRSDLTQKNWKQLELDPLAELEAWNEIAREVAGPFLEAWRALRYAAAIPVLLGAREAYDKLRAEHGALSYADLLIGAARLLRERPAVRRYFQERITHLLVDEFQDTDPVQAEVMMLLTADDPEERDWTRCRPRPGSLFVVGDPKQSIYRFRRADIATYNRVRDLIARSGEVLALSANFRSIAPIRDWVNGAFEATFPEEADAYQAARVPLTGGGEDPAGALRGIARLRTPGDVSGTQQIAEREAGLIARAIRSAIDAGTTVPSRDAAGGAAARPEHFLLLARGKARLATYARKLQEAGVPSVVTGGSGVNDVPELDLLSRAVRAVADPDDPVALVAALRSELFGVDDATLYALSRADGRFSFAARLPELAGVEGAGALREAWARLRRCADWADRLPAGAALERMAGELGLLARAGACEEGADRSGSLAKGIEYARLAARADGSPAALAAGLDRLVSGEVPRDGASARPPAASAVRVMNLHKAKGLEAPVVFLVDPSGAKKHEPELIVDRSGERAAGYLRILDGTGVKNTRELARPAAWDAMAEREELFLGAEEARLLYVAATRAGARIVVSERSKLNQWNPWRALGAHLAEFEELADSGPAAPPPAPAGAWPIGEREAADAAAAIAARWNAVAQPTYATRAAKTIAVRPDERFSAGEHGTEWGAAIHLMLEAAATRPGADLTRLGAAVFADLDLPPDGAAEAARLVGAVLGSDLWRRASKARRRLVEVPFQIGIAAGDPLSSGGAGGALPAVVRGVIDLVFEEPEGWVLVDYKTDDRGDRDLDALAAKHRGQLDTYAAAWTRITGAPVGEIGLYFVRTNRYVALAR